MVDYDPSVIREHADTLYSLANRIIVSSTVLGIILLGPPLFILGAMRADEIAVAAAGGLVGAVIGGLIGNSMGRARAFRIKLEAQTALCQVHVEENTRRLLQAR